MDIFYTLPIIIGAAGMGFRRTDDSVRESLMVFS